MINTTNSKKFLELELSQTDPGPVWQGSGSSGGAAFLVSWSRFAKRLAK
jgi:hypothetical protein